MISWLVAIAALTGMGLAVLCGVYAFLRLRPAINALRAEISATAERVEEASGWRNDERRLSRLLEKTQHEQEKLNQAIKKVEASINKVEASIAAAQSSVEKSVELKLKNAADAADLRATELGKRIVAIKETTARLPTINASLALSHQRLVSQQCLNDFVNVLAPKFGLELTHRHVHHMAHRICALELMCHGRLATSVDAIMTRLSAALFLAKDNPRSFHCVEIGTLYGIGAIALYDAVRFGVDQAKITVIDPLDGYYGVGAVDYVSMKPVSQRVFEENWRIAGCDAKDLNVIRELSESEAAKTGLGEEEVDLLVIDGDHSYEGVKRDFEGYFKRVRLGGIIVVDDYDVPEWPEIKKYADTELKERADLQWLFADHRTLLLRRI